MKLLLALMTALLACAASAQQPYPVKALKMIVPYPAGGPTDITARLITQKITEAWGQNFVIDNRPGGGGTIGATLFAKSPPDGYTLYLGGITTIVLAPNVHKNLAYERESRLPARQPDDDLTAAPDDASFASGAHGQRLRCACESEAGADQLRLVGTRRLGPPRRRAF
jgi:hypothetical protein